MWYNLIWFVLVCLKISGMDAPISAPQVPAPPLLVNWTLGTDAFRKMIKESARKTIILNDNQADKVTQNIKTVVNKRSVAKHQDKLVVLFVHKGDESFALAWQDPKSTTFGAFKKMALALAQIRFAPVAEKGRPLAQSVGAINGADVELITYAYGPEPVEEAAKLLDLFLHSLETLNQNKNLKIVIVAEGESAHVVNIMSQAAKRNPIDTLIYFQSPIYEWIPAATNYSYQSEASPKNFAHLYHVYTKGAPQIPGWSAQSLLYLERKYRQQARIENGQLVSPVKNIRALKVSPAGQLENFSLADFFNEQAINNYANLFAQADNYQVNTDLIAKVFDQSQASGSLAINRFVRLNGNTLEQSFGSSLVGYEYYYPIISLEGVSLKDLRRQFSLEVEESIGQLINITSIPTLEGWFVVSKLLGDVATDLARIKKDHISVLAHPLYELKVPVYVEQFSYLLTDKLKKAINTISQTSGLSAEFIENQIKLGAFYLRALLADQLEAIPTLTQEQYLRSIIAIIWFLYSQAIENNQQFDEGTFVIEDTDWKVNQFLMNYVRTYGAAVSGYQKKKLINQPLTGTLTDPDLNLSFNPYAYPRESSHFKISQRQFRHYGIDVRFGNSGELPLLPANKRHLLFGKTDAKRQLLFIKPENYGLYYKDGFLYHGSEFVESNARKLGLTIKTDDDPSYAKERIPKKFLEDFTAALQEAGFQKDTLARLVLLAKNDDEGIKILYVDDALLQKPPLKALEQKYAKLYNHLRLRTGREVILTNQDLRTILRLRQAPAAQQPPQLAAGRVPQPVARKRARTV